MSIVFLILHYKNFLVTERCIKSILQLDKFGTNIKIVVVDNGSEDNSTIQLKENYGNINEIDLLFLKAGNGFSRGNNLGYEYIKNKYKVDFLVVTNNDIIFSQKDFILKMLQEYEKYDYYVMGPNTIDLKSKAYLNPKGYLKTLNELEEDLKKMKRKKVFIREITTAWFQSTKIYPLYVKYIRTKRKDVIKQKKIAEEYSEERIIQGSCLIFSKNFLKKNNRIFEPETNFYVEEPILCHRCKLNNWKVLYSPKLTVLHEQGASFKFSTTKIKERIKRDLKYNIGGMEVYINMLKSLNNNKEEM